MASCHMKTISMEILGIFKYCVYLNVHMSLFMYCYQPEAGTMIALRFFEFVYLFVCTYHMHNDRIITVTT